MGKEFLHLLLITFVIVILYAFILDLAGMDQFDHKMEFLLKENKWLVGLIAIVIALLLEEPIYRLRLNFKKSSIWWGLGLSLLLISEAWITLFMLWIWLFFFLFKVSKGDQPNLKYSIFISLALLFYWGNYQVSFPLKIT